MIIKLLTSTHTNSNKWCKLKSHKQQDLYKVNYSIIIKIKINSNSNNNNLEWVNNNGLNLLAKCQRGNN